MWGAHDLMITRIVYLIECPALGIRAECHGGIQLDNQLNGVLAMGMSLSEVTIVAKVEEV